MEKDPYIFRMDEVPGISPEVKGKEKMHENGIDITGAFLFVESDFISGVGKHFHAVLVETQLHIVVGGNVPQRKIDAVSDPGRSDFFCPFCRRRRRNRSDLPGRGRKLDSAFRGDHGGGIDLALGGRRSPWGFPLSGGGGYRSFSGGN
jgi:hypothetical protein